MSIDSIIRGVSAGTGAEVKAASTAPVAADQALVVAISPNSPTHLVSQGTAAAVAGAWTVKVTDGTNTAAVKAASTAAVAADPAAVVSLSPNSPITLPVPTLHTLESAATTNATSVKASAGTMYSIGLTNTSATQRFFKIYNKASAPTVGTDIPIMTIPLPATSFQSIEFGVVGKRLATGIAYAITGAMPNADTTVIAASDVKVDLSYI